MPRNQNAKQINFIPTDEVLELLSGAANKTAVINEAIVLFYKRGGKTLAQRVQDIEEQLSMLVHRLHGNHESS